MSIPLLKPTSPLLFLDARQRYRMTQTPYLDVTPFPLLSFIISNAISNAKKRFVRAGGFKSRWEMLLMEN